MKFWKKIFISSIGLFLILYCSSGVVLIEKIQLENLNHAISNSIDKCTDLENNLFLNMDYMLGTDFTDESSLKNWLEIIVNGYSNTIEGEDFLVEVFDPSEKMIMSNSNLKIKGMREEIQFASEKEKKFLIRRVNGKRYVFVSSIINLNNRKVKIVTSRNVESIYQSRIRDYQFFSSIGVVIMGILAVGMYVISKKLTEPVVRLSDASRAIGRGDYRVRVVESNRYDEVGILEKNFNTMLEVINDSMNELEYANEAKQRFIDSLNHEIKTPITSIIGYSDLLIKSKVSEEVRLKALKYINEEARRLEFLNSTLLKLIVFREEGNAKESFFIKDCIMRAVSAFEFKLEQREMTVENEIEECVIIGDGKQCEVLITNMLDNAIKASKNGNKIEIQGRKKESCYQLLIRDHGIGIPKEEIRKIVEPFYMVDKARTRKNNGIGLGLALCHDICEKYGIKMEFESVLGEGTKVKLTFPVEQ